MNALAIIQARMGGTRFSGKVLRELHGTPILRRVVEACRAADRVDRVVVATPDVAIAEVCDAWKVDVHLELERAQDDVLGRFVGALKHFGRTCTHVVRVCADNPLVVPVGIDALCHAIDDADYCGYQLPDGRPAISRPTGYFAEVCAEEALRFADAAMRVGHRDREHVTRWLYRSGQFDCRWLDIPVWYHPDEPTAIDTEHDLKQVERLMEWRQDSGLYRYQGVGG